MKKISNKMLNFFIVCIVAGLLEFIIVHIVPLLGKIGIEYHKELVILKQNKEWFYIYVAASYIFFAFVVGCLQRELTNYLLYIGKWPLALKFKKFFKKISDSSNELKKIILKKLEAMVSTINNEPEINFNEIIEGLESGSDFIERVLKKCCHEIKEGLIDSGSVKDVINSMKEAKKIIAISASPIYVWFVPEIIYYIIEQIKLVINNKVIIKRYVISNQEEINKFIPQYLQEYDEYIIAREIHRCAIKLVGVPLDAFKQYLKDIASEENWNVDPVKDDQLSFLIIFKDKETQVWPFVKIKGKTKFIKAEHERDKKKYIEIYEKILDKRESEWIQINNTI